MSDFKVEMLQIVCRLGLYPRPRWGSFFTALPQTPSWILGGILLREGTPCFPVTPHPLHSTATLPCKTITMKITIFIIVLVLKSNGTLTFQTVTAC